MHSTKSLHCLVAILIVAIRNGSAQQTGCGVPSSEESRWPWHVAVLRADHQSKLRYVCAGTLISQTHVLTAAHCETDPRNGSYSDIVIATADIQQRQVKATHKMRNYTRESLRYDIAILELESPVNLTKHVQLACLLLEKDLTDMVGTLVSWETAGEDETSLVQLETILPVVDPLTCLKSNRNFFAMNLDEGMVCAGYELPTEICDADSGGGLFFQVDKVWFLGGVMSFTNPATQTEGDCVTNEYVVFTTIFDALPWIREVTKMGFGEVDHSLDPENCIPRILERDIIIRSHLSAFPKNCGLFTPHRNPFEESVGSLEVPWMAIIRYKTGNNFCAGTLISNRYVLTAAHCVEAHMNPYQVRLGEHMFNETTNCYGRQECASTRMDVDIHCVIQHQHYHGSKNDIALVRLVRRVQFEGTIQPTCLPATLTIRDSVLHRYYVTGWDRTGHAASSSWNLRKAAVAVASRSTCRNLLSKNSIQKTSNHICVSASYSAVAFFGDHGGPLVNVVPLNGSNRFVQFGILSFEANSSAAVFTKVADYMNWIVFNMRE